MSQKQAEPLFRVTHSTTPKTKKERLQFLRAEDIIARGSGKENRKDFDKGDWGAVEKVYGDERMHDKTAKLKNVKRTKKSKAVSRY